MIIRLVVTGRLTAVLITPLITLHADWDIDVLTQDMGRWHLKHCSDIHMINPLALFTPPPLFTHQWPHQPQTLADNQLLVVSTHNGHSQVSHNVNKCWLVSSMSKQHHSVGHGQLAIAYRCNYPEWCLVSDEMTVNKRVVL